MGKIPEEAVTAAASALRWSGDTLTEMATDALTAALPFLPVQVAVKKLEWRNVDAVCAWCYAKTPIGEYRVTWSFNESGQKLHYPYGMTKQFDGAGYGDRDATKAAAQADYEARILSALEPSAARELALEEVKLERSIERWRGMKPSEVMKGSTAQITYALEDARKDILSLARALSSPDHADAGKVEGDGWTVEYEVYSGDEWQASSYDFDGAAGYAVMYAAEGLKDIAIHEVRRRIVTAAPASEGAE